MLASVFIEFGLFTRREREYDAMCKLPVERYSRRSADNL